MESPNGSHRFNSPGVDVPVGRIPRLRITMFFRSPARCACQLDLGPTQASPVTPDPSPSPSWRLRGGATMFSLAAMMCLHVIAPGAHVSEKDCLTHIEQDFLRTGSAKGGYLVRRQRKASALRDAGKSWSVIPGAKQNGPERSGPFYQGRRGGRLGVFGLKIKARHQDVGFAGFA